MLPKPNIKFPNLKIQRCGNFSNTDPYLKLLNNLFSVDREKTYADLASHCINGTIIAKDPYMKKRR